MDYEEYKKKLEKVKEVVETLNEVNDSTIARVTSMKLQNIFPEVRESEDEKMRTELINGFKECLKDSQYPKNAQKYFHNIKIEDILAWLEKPGKEEYALKSFKDEDVRKFMQYIEKEAKAYEFNLPNRGYDIYAFAKDLLIWLEKQNKNLLPYKPKFEVGDKLVSTKNPRLTYEVLKVGNVNELGNLEYEIEIFTDEKPGIQVGDTFKEHNIHLMECVKVDEWAKLVDEAKSKWSEEDENFFANICTIINADRNFTESAKRKCKDWLKSLKDRVQPQNRWKPSKEQIEAIRLARTFIIDDFSDNPTLSEILIELEKQLKKLKGE